MILATVLRVAALFSLSYISALVICQERQAQIERPNVAIDYVGFLPGNQDEHLSGQFDVEFSIYLTPTGGRPIWSESHQVEARNGRIALRLGSKNAIPWSVTVANFKFLSAHYGRGLEILPRMPIVNVAFVARSVSDSILMDHYDEALPTLARRQAATWIEAFDSAAAEGGRLLTYLEWYRMNAQSKTEETRDQYQWTLPWVYDTASHGSLNDLFRGRFQGCDYMDLDPSSNKYSYYIAFDKRKH